ncbi:protein translocase subunit SecD [Terrimesophilobacter mesophilus]|uniref:Protein translocase subunit SecD n=1 Tax=Terrimesophilobacter mesophilus TaxID=433647 RepID=A0A4R8VD64_9MICO|nr:protein translocase subunit SecD [Terrimesophilobacter mesophilus]TFB80675.1 protein translocase subunit SecD [Terrimesophilobacter mesophilus]
MVIIVGLIAINGGGALLAGWNWVPKLALDLIGGTQIILAPKLESGQSVSADQLNQAVSIIRQRIDAAGVSESEINTQGSSNVVVSLPGIPDQATIDRIESSAKLEFRAVIQTDAAAVSNVGETPSPSPSPGASDSPAPSTSPEPAPSISPSNASDPAWVTPALQKQFDDFNCADVEKANTNVAPADKPLITCEINGTLTDALPDYKYILGPVEVSGERIKDATNGLVANSQGVSTNQWGVNIVFDAEGAKQFGEVTTRLYGLTGARHQFAIVLDGQVISAPTTNAVITDGKPQITGSFTQETSKTLADQLKFGALPIGFLVQSKESITATLGTTQLLSGLLAGAIGLMLVIGYSLLQYRTLGLVTVASLVVAFSITYLIVTILSWREGYRLSLAGVAGLIVAIGITADSFIVYFERIRDELRDGRVLVSAVEAGWKRALRTIFASDAVNFLAAIVLFLLAVGNVRGFALTLGLTTIVDVLVVTMFTHPMMQLLANTEFFGGGHRFSGLDPKALGAVYRGRAQFRAPAASVGSGKAASASKEAARRQTIAERKAAELAAGKPGTSSQRSKGKDS